MAHQAASGRGRTAWREEILQERDRLEMELGRSDVVLDPSGTKYIHANLDIASDAATRIHKGFERIRSWWAGIDSVAGWRSIHAAKQALYDGLPDAELRAQLPILRSKVTRYLDPNDAERIAYEGWIKGAADPKQPIDRVRLRTVRSAVDGVSDDQYDKIHRFRNTLYLLFLGVIILDIVLILPAAGWLPICAPPIVPGGGSSCPPVGQVELAGLIGGVLAAAAALLRIPVAHEPYNLKRAQTLVKLPLSALTAIVGLMLVQSNVIGALQPEATSAVLAYAAIFGYSQQLVTRLIDQKAQSLVSPEINQTVSS